MKKKIICISLCVGIILSSVIYCFAATINVDGCNWMSVIKDDTSIADISMPGTHDAAATYVAFGIKARCQDKTIPEQLNCGARFLDIRLSVSGSKLKLVHNFINCRKGSGFTSPKLYFDDVTKYCIEFLKNNPKECIVIFAKEDFGSKDNFDDLLLKYISKNPSMWYTENRIPNIGEVRGKIVLMNRFAKSGTKLTDKNGGINLTNFPDQGDNAGSYLVAIIQPFTSSSISSSYTVQDRYNYPKDQKWSKAIVPAFELEKVSGELLINFLSTANGLSPEINAKYINKKVSEYKFDKNKCYGAVLFDFIDESVARQIYECNSSVNNFSLSPAPSQSSQVPKPRHGIIRFLDTFWAKIIEKFS